ncbi:hypothetical protein Tco_1265324 [Tanacetum coccineum]
MNSSRSCYKIKSGEIKVKSDPANVNSGFVVNTGHFGLILVASKLSLVATILILVELATQQRQNSDRQSVTNSHGRKETSR